MPALNFETPTHPLRRSPSRPFRGPSLHSRPILGRFEATGLSFLDKSTRNPAKMAGLCIVAAALLAGAGCGAKQAAPPTDSSTASEADSAPISSTAKKTDLAHPVVRIETDLGAITLKLDAETAPGTVRNFLNYVTDGFYNDTTFHYVAPGSMILGGGYTAGGRAKSPKFPPVRNEAHNGRKNLRGTVAMARDAAVIDSATSQFFINLADAPQRDFAGEAADQYGYCVFGEVIEGLDVADRISESPTRDLGGDLAQSPHPPVAINLVRLM
jgi:peptidyl-prolyl cis-trans isomerase A (cyclophilin A)